MRDTTIHCGIFGYGKMGRIRAAAIQESGLGQVSKVYDVQPLADCHYPQVTKESGILDDPEIEAVFICTPNYRIPELCKAAMRAGKHVFAEKPPAFNAAQLEEVIAVERDTGKKLMYGFNHRHHGSIQKMKEIVDRGDMGRILWMRGRYGKEVDEDYFKGWRADPEKAGGGILLDQGIHMLDLFLYFAGPFDEVHALVSNLFWQTPGLEDNVFAIMRNSETGVCASLHSTMTQWRYLFSLEVFLQKGALILNGLKTTSGAYGEEELAIKYNRVHPERGEFESEEKIIFKRDESWLEETKAFFFMIYSKNKSSTPGSREAAEVMRQIDRIYKFQQP